MANSRVALMTSNGTGMGHLSRQIALAHALTSASSLPGRSPGKRFDPIFFSLSRAVPVIATYGFRGEYCPSRERGWMPASRWQEYLRERVHAFAEETGIETLIFDGVVPYQGLLRARLDLPDVRFVWMRRGFWRHRTNTASLRSSRYFDLVLEPGDLAGAADDGPTAGLADSIRVPPVSVAEHIPRLSRLEAAEALGLDPDRPAALITLSSGRLNDVAGVGAAAVSALLEDPVWQVAVSRSALTQIGVPLTDRSRCVELSGVYPLAQYLPAFDAAVSGGGYNSVHELLYAGVPTLFLPNRSSTIDNQVRRTLWLADHGLALHGDETSSDDIYAKVRLLFDASFRASLRQACQELPQPHGSQAAASAIARLTGGKPTLPGPLSAARASLRARSEVARILGPRATSSIRSALRRGPKSGPSRPLPVVVTDDPSFTVDAGGPAPLLMTDNLDAMLLSRTTPLENLVPDATDAYRARRRALVDRYFAVSTPSATAVASTPLRSVPQPRHASVMDTPNPS